MRAYQGRPDAARLEGAARDRPGRSIILSRFLREFISWSVLRGAVQSRNSENRPKRAAIDPPGEGHRRHLEAGRRLAQVARRAQRHDTQRGLLDLGKRRRGVLAYLRYVQRQAQAAITAAGLSGDVGRFDSHHNPIRLAGDLRLHGRVVDDPERELAGHQFRFWALDLACLADREFWSD